MAQATTAIQIGVLVDERHRLTEGCAPRHLIVMSNFVEQKMYPDSI
jgi:hypothetical protein